MEAGITEEGCVPEEAHGFGFRREYHDIEFSKNSEVLSNRKRHALNACLFFL